MESADDALAGARDIIAEWINEDQQARASIRALFLEKGKFKTTGARGKDIEGSKYRDYADWEEPIGTAPSHRVLAMRRGEQEGFLSLRVVVSEPEALAIMSRLFLKGKGSVAEQVTLAMQDSFFKALVSINGNGNSFGDQSPRGSNSH